MAEGTKSYEGLAVPLFGESEIEQQTAATDILTLTGATSQSGDFIVCQDGSGNEKFVVSSSGLITSAVAMSFTSVDAALSSTATSAGVSVTVTSTGAIAAGSVVNNGFLVAPSSKANMNAAFAYSNSTGGTAGATNYLLACHGSKSPNYFLGVGATAVGTGGATDNGFVDAGLFLTSALATTVAMVGLKVLFGDSTFYVMCVTATAMSA